MNKTIKRQMRKSLKASLNGWRIWHKLVHKNSIKDGIIILIPEKDEKLCFCAALYLNELLIQKNSKKAIFLSCDARIKEYINLYANNVDKILDVTDKEMKDLLQFYRLFNFDNRFVVASFKQPFGRNGDKMLELYPEKYQELFALCIYKLKPYSSQLNKKLITEN